MRPSPSIPELTTAHVLVNRLCIDDAAALYALRRAPEVARFQSWAPASVADARAFDGTSLLGDLSLCFSDHTPPQVEFGISIDPAHHGKGIATAAVRVVLHHLFTRCGVHRVHASVDPQNRACVAMLERVGMRREAHLRQSLWFRGTWVDDLIYAVLATEWPSAAGHGSKNPGG